MSRRLINSTSKNSSRGKKGILFGIPIFLLLCGIALITFAGWNLIKQTYFVSKVIVNKPSTNTPIKKITINNKKVEYPRNGDQLGTLIIPSISLNYPIIEGDDQENLAKGVGHDSSTPIPGQVGNIVLDAHRDTMFRNLGDLKIGDNITIETKYGKYTYKVYKTRIVTPDDTTAIIKSDKQMLTLYTCYPFNYIGHAPKRYIVMTEFVSSTDTNKIN
ncbi:MAG: class D sortase [Bacillota bacterium]|nr:class D sortase [Bacillota bacterium]